jgi:hypothetical protein
MAVAVAKADFLQTAVMLVAVVAVVFIRPAVVVVVANLKLYLLLVLQTNSSAVVMELLATVHQFMVVALVEIVRLGFLIQVAVLYMAALVVALGAEQLLVTQQFQVQQAEICPRKVVVGDQGVQLTQMVQMEQRNQTLGERALVAADLLLQARLAPAAMV